MGNVEKKPPVNRKKVRGLFYQVLALLPLVVWAVCAMDFKEKNDKEKEELRSKEEIIYEKNKKKKLSKVVFEKKKGEKLSAANEKKKKEKKKKVLIKRRKKIIFAIKEIIKWANIEKKRLGRIGVGVEDVFFRGFVGILIVMTVGLIGINGFVDWGRYQKSTIERLLNNWPRLPFGQIGAAEELTELGYRKEAKEALKLAEGLIYSYSKLGVGWIFEPSYKEVDGKIKKPEIAEDKLLNIFELQKKYPYSISLLYQQKETELSLLRKEDAKRTDELILWLDPKLKEIK